jgi:hypothetical protein
MDKRNRMLLPYAIILMSGLAAITALAQTTDTDHAADAVVADPNPVDPTIIRELVGKWMNQLESKLIIKKIDQQTGQITGTYQTKAGAGTQGQIFPMIGWVNSAPVDPKNPDHVIVVSFSVRWGKVGSVTAWNGYYYTPAGKQPVIVGQWLLTRPNTMFEWDHILAGQDQFHRIRERE